MARFKYLGEPPFPFVESTGSCHTIDIPVGDGTVQTVLPPGGIPAFVIGDDIGVNITNWLSLISMRNNPRYQEIP